MRRRLLVRHFLNQFVENEFAPDVDRHQILAVALAALITLPLFATIFMSVKFLMQPLQSPGWTEIMTMGDQVVFCATSLLVSAAIATLEWDALALSPRDSVILGVLPVPREEIVRAKVLARKWQDQSATPLSEPWPLDSWPDVPTRVLASRHDRMFPIDLQRRVARKRLAIGIDEIDGGHMVALSNPAALADRLEGYLTIA